MLSRMLYGPTSHTEQKRDKHLFCLKKYYNMWRFINVRRSFFHYLTCGAKTVTFLFWASLYMLVMRMTIFKSESPNKPVKDWSIVPDNYTKWLFQGPVLGDDVTDKYPKESNILLEPDNKTIVELDQRAAKVQEVCQMKGLPTQSINSMEFFVDHAHNIVWCNIFKAASSSWLYNFNLLGGYDIKYLSRTRVNPITLARKKFPRPSEDELKDAVNTPGVISLIVVRDPFVRLLSAYRDKLENVAPPFYRNLAKAIVREYRNKTKQLFPSVKTIGPTFYEFVLYLTEKNKNKTLIFDEHWAPYYQFCSPCAVNFSVVAKVETFTRDTDYVINQLGLGQVLGRQILDRRTRVRTVMNRSRDGRNTTKLLRHYFGQLNARLIDGLLEIYGLDFEMFGYDPKVYYQYVKRK